MRTEIERLIYRRFGGVHAGQIVRQMHLRRLFRSLAPAPQAVLDAGCGTGQYSFFVARTYPNARIDAFDVQLDEVRASPEAAEYPQVSFKKMGIEELEAREEYDLAYSIEVLEHIPDPRGAVRRLVRAVRPGGTVVIHSPVEPARRHFKRFENWENEDHVVDGFQRADFERYLREAGCDVVESRYTAGWFGSLAWELYQMAAARRHAFAYLLLPVSVALAWIDLRWPNPWGNNFLIVAKRRA